MTRLILGASLLLSACAPVVEPPRAPVVDALHTIWTVMACDGSSSVEPEGPSGRVIHLHYVTIECLPDVGLVLIWGEDDA